MKLIDYLNKRKGGYVKIGSGSCFFYCGKCDFQIKKRITEISDNFHRVYVCGLTRAKRRKILYGKKLETAKSEKEIKSLKNKIRACEVLIKNTTDYLEKWLPLLEREIIDIYNGTLIDEPPATIIVVKGKENGQFWTFKEQDEYYQKLLEKKKKSYKENVLEKAKERRIRAIKDRERRLRWGEKG